MKVAVLGANWSPCAEPMDQAVVPATGLPSPSVQLNAVPPHSWTSIPRCCLYQARSAGASLALKKMPPTPVTRFIKPPRSSSSETYCVFFGLALRFSGAPRRAPPQPVVDGVIVACDHSPMTVERSTESAKGLAVVKLERRSKPPLTAARRQAVTYDGYESKIGSRGQSVSRRSTPTRDRDGLPVPKRSLATRRRLPGRAFGFPTLSQRDLPPLRDRRRSRRSALN